MDSVNDPPGHGPDVGPAVSADIRLIPDAAETDTDISASERVRYALSDAGFSGARRTDKAQNGTRLLSAQRHHGELLDDPLFHLLQAGMVMVQDFPGLPERDRLGRFLFPGKRGQQFEIVRQHAGFRALAAFILQAGQHAPAFSLGCLIHAG